jgi:hypothetical protein
LKCWHKTVLNSLKDFTKAEKVGLLVAVEECGLREEVEKSDHACIWYHILN